MTTIKPTFDRVAIRPEDPPSNGKVIIEPDNAREPNSEGVVIAVGPGHYAGGVFIPISLKVGDRVWFGAYHGIDHEFDGIGKVKILSESEVLAVIERSSLVLPS